MSCEEYKILLSGLIDGELDSAQKKIVSDHLLTCDVCKDEHAKLNKLKEVTDDMKYFDLPDRLRAQYWHEIYNRLERGTGWIFFSIGVIITLAYAGWLLLNEFFLNPAEPMILKIGIGILIIGFIILLVSITRERLFSRKHDRYDEVEI